MGSGHTSLWQSGQRHAGHDSRLGYHDHRGQVIYLIVRNDTLHALFPIHIWSYMAQHQAFNYMRKVNRNNTVWNINELWHEVLPVTLHAGMLPVSPCLISSR